VNHVGRLHEGYAFQELVRKGLHVACRQELRRVNQLVHVHIRPFEHQIPSIKTKNRNSMRKAIDETQQGSLDSSKKVTSKRGLECWRAAETIKLNILEHARNIMP